MRYNGDMTSPLSIRFDRDVLERLRRRAAGTPGATPSGVAQRLVDEGLRMAEHPGVVFKDGPGGRRAALTVGPDMWELVKFLREIDERGELALAAASDVFVIPETAVRAGVAYYTNYPDEIDAWIADAEAISERAEHAWRQQQELLG
jgi:predicted transcriptional regulator